MSDAPAELAGYRVEQELGEGGMARVYRAYDPRFDRYVALKILKPGESADPALVARFLDEARNAGPLSHPNIVRVHRVEAQPRPFIDMELVEGPTLGAWLAENGGRLPWPEATRIARDLASALEHAHRLGRVHRDVKPGNVLMADQGRTPKLVDFGIAMIDQPEATRLTRHGEVLGTPRYMSPEQVRGETVDARADLYALGAVLYEMLAGAPAVEGDGLVAVTTRIVTAQPKPLRERVADVPPALVTVVEQLMAKDRAARFANAADTRAALEACMGKRDGPLPDPDWRGLGGPGGNAQGRRRFGLPLAIGTVAALAVLGTLLWLFVVPPEPPLSPPLPPLAQSPPTVPPLPAGQAMPTNRPPRGGDADNQMAATDREVIPAGPPAPDPEGEFLVPPVNAALAVDPSETISLLYDELRIMPCARLETDRLGAVFGVRVASADPAALAAVGSRLGQDAGSVNLRGVQLPAGAVACGVFDLINRETAPASSRFLRLEAPVDGVCDAADRASCYSGLSDGLLVEGERLVVTLDPPPGTGHVLVDYFMTDGNVAHLFPPRGPDDENIPAASFARPTADMPVVIGDSRAGAADQNEYPIQSPFGHELVLAIAAAAPLFTSPRPFIEPMDGYLAGLAAALARQPSPAKASSLWLETAARHP